MRTLTSSLSVAATFLVAFALHTGCSSDSTTGSGAGTDGGSGSDAGTSAQDSGSSGTDSGSATDAGSTSDGATGTKSFGDSCTDGSECKSGVCFVGGSQSFCSLKCTAPTDCPVPPTSGQCNNMGYCKK